MHAPKPAHPVKLRQGSNKHIPKRQHLLIKRSGVPTEHVEVGWTPLDERRENTQWKQVPLFKKTPEAGLLA